MHTRLYTGRTLRALANPWHEEWDGEKIHEQRELLEEGVVRITPLKNGGDHSCCGRFGPLRNRPWVFWCHFSDSWRQDEENSEKTAKKRAKMGEIWPNKKEWSPTYL